MYSVEFDGKQALNNSATASSGLCARFRHCCNSSAATNSTKLPRQDGAPQRQIASRLRGAPQNQTRNERNNTYKSQSTKTDEDNASSNDNSPAPIIAPSSKVGQMSQTSQTGQMGQTRQMGQIGQTGQFGTNFVNSDYCQKTENILKPECKRFNEICQADKYNPNCPICKNPNPDRFSKQKCLKRKSVGNIKCLPEDQHLYNPYCTLCQDYYEDNKEACDNYKKIHDLDVNSGIGGIGGIGDSETTNVGGTAYGNINFKKFEIPQDQLNKLKGLNITPYYLYEVNNLKLDSETITGYEIEAA